jgi:hypothetical protein
MQRAVWAGANNGSYPLASAALRNLAEIRLSAKQVRRLVGAVGRARIVERDEAVAQLQALPLPKRRAGSRAVDPPELAVISMDGGRYQRRDHFGEKAAATPDRQHWRESKIGCLLSMRSDVADADPAPEFPDWLASSEAVRELAKMAEKSPLNEPASPSNDETPVGDSGSDLSGYDPPELIRREVLASGADAAGFGWQLEARAWQLAFPAAARQAFVADGAAVNWNLQRTHFPRATPILDLMHALSYAYAAAKASGASYRAWAKLIWQGQVLQVIAELREQQARLGTVPSDPTSDDPQAAVSRALVYYQHQQSRMNYPRYRQLGLPLTSSHIESTIKQINRRVKGSEKFWDREAGEAVLQLRADTLCDSQPLTAFWQRWQAQQTGSNRYQTAA